MAKKRIPNQETLDEIARLMNGFRFVFGDPIHLQISETIERLEHKLMLKIKTLKDKEEITRLKKSILFLIEKTK